MGDLGFGPANLMDEVVDRISTELLHRANLTSDNVPIQSAPVANVTDQNLIQQLLDQNKELIRCLTDAKNKSQDRPRRALTSQNKDSRVPHCPYGTTSTAGLMGVATIKALLVETRHPGTRMRRACQTRWEVARMPVHPTDDVGP